MQLVHCLGLRTHPQILLKLVHDTLLSPSPHFGFPHWQWHCPHLLVWSTVIFGPPTSLPLTQLVVEFFLKASFPFSCSPSALGFWNTGILIMSLCLQLDRVFFLKHRLDYVILQFKSCCASHHRRSDLKLLSMVFTTYLSIPAALTINHRWCFIYNRNVWLQVLEAGKSKIQASARSPSGESPLPAS